MTREHAVSDAGRRTPDAQAAASRVAKSGEPAAAVRLIGAVPPPPAFDWPGPLDLEIASGRMTTIWTLPSLAHPLIRLAIGLRSPAVGRVEVLGVEAGFLPRYEGMRFRRRLGVAMQPGGLISNVNLRTNLMVPLLYAGIADMEESQVLVDDVLGAIGIARWADRRPSDVPPEVRQAAIVARALVRRPELLVLEAPFRALFVPLVFFDALWVFAYRLAELRSQPMLEARRYMKKITDY